MSTPHPNRRRFCQQIAAGLAVVLAVVGWNVFQRVSLMRAPQPSDIAEIPETWRLGTVPGQQAAMRLTAPRPAPPPRPWPPKTPA